MGSNEHNYIHWGTIKAASFLADRWAPSLSLPIAAFTLSMAQMRGPVGREVALGRAGPRGASPKELTDGSQVAAGLPSCYFHLWWLAFASFLSPPSPPSLLVLRDDLICCNVWKLPHCANKINLSLCLFDTLEMCRVTRTGFQLELKEPRNGMVAREQARWQLMSSSLARDQRGKTQTRSGKGGKSVLP